MEVGTTIFIVSCVKLIALIVVVVTSVIVADQGR